ncbi:MAG: hypothetical protein R2695_15350 [Acidimicrobiales bacterium]
MGVTPAFVASTVIDLGDALALGFVSAGVWAWRRDRGIVVAVVLFTLAALTRETTLFVPLAVAVWEGRGRARWLLVAPAVLAAWIIALQWWVGDPGKSATQFRPPFAGWLDPHADSGGERRGGVARRVALGGAATVAHRPRVGDRPPARRGHAGLRRSCRPLQRAQPEPGDTVGDAAAGDRAHHADRRVSRRRPSRW